MTQRILILGATGFIGRNMTEYFAQQTGYEVHAVRFNRPEYDCPNVIWHQADLRDPNVYEALIQEGDIIVQAAATTSGSKDIVTRPFIHVTDNAVMNSYLFRTAFEKKAKHVLFFSCTVMYPTSDTALKESDFDANTPLHPRYFGVGNTKLYIEKMCEFFAGIGETKFTAIRHSNIYGPHDKYDLERSHVFGATVTKVMTAEDTLTVWGKGEEGRDLLHVNDLVSFVQAAIDKQGTDYALYNCGYGEKIRIIDLVKKIIHHAGKDLTIEHDLSKPSINTSLFLDCTKAENELGWKKQITIDEGIQDTLQWWLANVAPTLQTDLQLS